MNNIRQVLKNMNRKQLHELIKEQRLKNDIKGFSTMNKDILIDKLSKLLVLYCGKLLNKKMIKQMTIEDKNKKVKEFNDKYGPEFDIQIIDGDKLKLSVNTDTKGDYANVMTEIKYLFDLLSESFN